MKTFDQYKKDISRLKNKSLKFKIFKSLNILWKPIVMVLFGILFILLKDNFQIVAGGSFFIFLGINSLYDYFKNNKKSTLSKISIITEFTFGILTLLLGLFKIDFNVLVILPLFSFFIILIIVYIKKTIGNDFVKIIESFIISGISLYLFYFYIKLIPSAISEIINNGLSAPFYVSLLIVLLSGIILFSIISKYILLIFDIKNPYLDFSIGCAIIILFSGFSMIEKIASQEEILLYVIGIFSAIFISISTISSLKNIIKNN